MILLVIGAVIVCLLIILVLERNIPSRKVFFAFCITMFLTAGLAGYSIMNAFNTNEEISESTIRHITAQQQIFIGWYNPYKKRIDALDYQWTQFHKALEDYHSDLLTINELYDQLAVIEADIIHLNTEINQLEVPIGLDDDNYGLTVSLLKKAKTYSNAQLKTVQAVKASIEPDKLKLDKHDEIYQLIKHTTLSNAPDALFTAVETSALRANLTIPEID